MTREQAVVPNLGIIARTITDQVYQILRTSIMNQTFVPGQRLQPDELAQQRRRGARPVRKKANTRHDQAIEHGAHWQRVCGVMGSCPRKGPPECSDLDWSRAMVRSHGTRCGYHISVFCLQSWRLSAIMKGEGTSPAARLCLGACLGDGTFRQGQDTCVPCLRQPSLGLGFLV